MKRTLALWALIIFIAAKAQATDEDSLKQKRFVIHFQQTFVEQYHPAFATSTGSGDKSLSSSPESCLSSTTTVYMGFRLWKNAELYFNPEVAAGSGFSGATGVAGFTNGETFRVGSPAPSVYIARFFFRQTFAIGKKEYSFREEDQNKIPVMLPDERIVFTFGKFSISDIFDGNVTSHDPKTSLLNWAMMDAGAWDYPSNTRGYTYALSIKVQKKQFNLRLCTAVASQWSNGMVTSGFIATPADWLKAHGETLELTVPIKKRNTIKLTLWANHAPMGSFRQATQSLLNDTSAANREVVGPTTGLNDGSSHLVSPALDSLRGKGGPYYGKAGIVLNWEMNLRNDNTEKNMVFIRGSWNDGKRESWMYTEIDESLCAGAFVTADGIKRPDDIVRIAAVVNGISKDHADYLKAGGYGFIIGDGLGHYPKGIRPEFIIEAQYNFKYKFITLTPDYQFIINPAYNAARGPVNVFGLRAHFEI